MIGKEIANYVISSRLGAGGMGEVYRARDTKLGRDVAMKVLPEALAQDPERIARFEREAKVLASLNHAGIASLYGLEESEGRHFLVMELVEGETLAERIQRGAVPVEEALKIAHQIAEALEFAHEKGVIHRDLKPANIKITAAGKVKVLDFGLAKAFAPTAETRQDILTSPTLSLAATIPGVILGTAPYMSPEQAKGLDADPRSDIFSFGSVLYEMLTGRPSFDGDTVTEVIASVLARDPKFDALPGNMNPRIEDLIRRCLEKDVKRRRQAIADVRVEIEGILADPQGLKFQLRLEPRPLWKRALPIVATAIVIAALTAALMWSLRPRSEPQRIMRFPFALPEGQRLTRTGRHMITISPDGTNTVYVANQQLYLRPLSEIESRPIQGTALDVDTPIFSPDGGWVAFHSNGEARFKKIAITGGASVTICEASLPFGASWTSDGHILIGAGTAGILRVNENGGKPETIVSVKSDEQAHGPQLLPDGDSILFTLTKGNTGAERWDKAQIVIHSLKSGQRKVLLEGGSDARYLPTGNIVYALGATLLAVPFDLKHLKVTGGPVPIVEGVLRSGTPTGAANFSFSNDGTLVYIPGGVPNAAGARSLVLVDRNGVRKPLPVPPGSYFQPRFSPNGKQLAVSSDDGKEVFVSVYDLTGAGSMRRLTFGGANRFPLWSRDGQRIVFQSDREKDLALFWQRADGNGTAQRLTRPESNLDHVPDSWADDGKTLIFSVGGVDPSIWSVSVDRDSKANILIDAHGSLQNNSSVSPDGRWVAYMSAEAGGTANIFVQPYPPTRAQFQLTTDLSLFPIWSPDGKQIFFVSARGGTGDLWSIDVQTKPGFTFGKPIALPIKNIIINGGQGNPRGYDIGPDGKFVVMVPAIDNQANQQTQQIFTNVHWFEEVKQKFAGN